MSPELVPSLAKAGYSLVGTMAHALGIDLSHFDSLSTTMDADEGVMQLASTGTTEVAPVEQVVIKTLGTNPVVPESKIPDGKTAIEVGFEDTTDNGINDSAIEKSAMEVAKRFGMNPEETKQFMDWVHNNKAQFIEASKMTGYDKGGVKDVMIQYGEGVMGNGSGGAQDVKLQLTKPEQMVQAVYTLPDGRQVVFSLADKCGNPMLSLPPVEAPVVAPPAMVCPDGGTTVSKDPNVGPEQRNLDGTPVTGGERNLQIRKGEEIPVVTIKDMPADGLAKDFNKDGDFVEGDKDSRVGVSWDKDDDTGKQEILPGITEKRIEDDIKYFEDQYGHKPKFIVYDVTDCNGRNVVACWNVAEGKWGFFYPDTPEGIPVDTNGDPVYQKSLRGDFRRVGTRTPAIIDTHDELMVYLGKQEGKIT